MDKLLHFFKRKIFLTISIAIISLLLIVSQKAYASHAMALDLTYTCLGGNKYEFTLSFYRDCYGIPAPGSPTLHIQSRTCNFHTHIKLVQQGAGVEVSSICNAQIANSSCSGGSVPGVQRYVYKGTYTLPANCTDWVFSYSECCRNNLITNLSTKQNIYVEATLNNTNSVCNSSPVFTNIPVPYMCSGQPYSYNHGVVDSDGDSLIYSLVNPLQGKNQLIGYKPGYSVYNPINSQSGSFQFDKTTGQMDLIPNGTQVSVVAIQVKEYRNGVLLGTAMRDMQAIVINCSNTIPYLTDGGKAQNHSGGLLQNKNTIEVCPGEEIVFDIEAKDDDGDDITLVSNISTVIPGAQLTIVSGGSAATGQFKWKPILADEGVYTFSVTVSDNACPIAGRQTYSYTIKVLTSTLAGPDKYFCVSGGKVPLNAIGGTVFEWTMLDGSSPASLSCTNCSDPFASPSVNSTYVVTSNFSSNCRNKDTVTVFVVPDFQFSKSDDVHLCSIEEGVQMNVLPDNSSSSYTYSWEPVSSLSDANSQNPVARPSVTTKYYPTVTSAEGCSRRDSILITVKGLIDVSIFPYDSVQTCDSVSLNLFLVPKGVVFSETFHHELDNSNWISISGGLVSSDCGAVNDEAYYMNGTGARSMETKNVDVQTGGVIGFYLKAGFCNQCSCDKPENDEQDENLYLDYSIDDGMSWISLEVFDADVYSVKNAFEYVMVNIPDGAKSSSTRFRWYQLNHLLDKDVWILDEISIREGLGNYTYSWTPSNTVSDPEIANPTVFPNETTTYTVTVTDDETGCEFKDSVKVKFIEEFSATQYSEFTYCPHDPAFQLQATTPDGAIYTYQWYPNKNISDVTISNPKVAPTTSTLYTVVIENPGTKCYRREEIYVNVPPDFNVNIMPDTSICLGQKLLVDATVSPEGDYEYLWRPITNVSDQALLTPLVSPKSDVQHILYVKDLSSGCAKSDTINIKVYPDFKVSVSDTKTLCPEVNGVEISVSASPGSNYEYRWTTGGDIVDAASPVQLVKPSTDTVYHVLCHQLDGCWKKDSIKVEIYSDLLDLHVSNDTIIREEDQAFLYSYGAQKYWWKNQDILLDSVASMIVAPTVKTIYTVVGYDACYADTLEVTVDVIPIDFFIPNLITPNGDNKNESFQITNFGKRWNLDMYNRWGDLIYQKDMYIDEWNGDGVPEGIYFYVITDVTTSKVYQGWVQLSR